MIVELADLFLDPADRRVDPRCRIREDSGIRVTVLIGEVDVHVVLEQSEFEEAIDAGISGCEALVGS